MNDHSYHQRGPRNDFDRQFNDRERIDKNWDDEHGLISRSTEKEVISFLASEGIEGVSVRMLNNKTVAEIRGCRNCFSVMHEILMLNTEQFRKGDGAGKIKAVKATRQCRCYQPSTAKYLPPHRLT